jgi:hypothetical protein
VIANCRGWHLDAAEAIGELMIVLVSKCVRQMNRQARPAVVCRGTKQLTLPTASFERPIKTTRRQPLAEMERFVSAVCPLVPAGLTSATDHPLVSQQTRLMKPFY